MKREWHMVLSFPVLTVFVLALLAVGSPSAAQEKKPLNVDKNGVAVHGYDPVAYFSEGKAIKGDFRYQSKFSVKGFLIGARLEVIRSA